MLKDDLFRMRDAIDQYYADKGKYPADLEALVTDGYLREVPKTPSRTRADTWQTIPAEPDPDQPERRDRHLRRQERLGGHRARRHEIQRVVMAAAMGQ